jgi:hypothetical protein
MKTSAPGTFSRSKNGQPGNPGEPEVFVLCIDRAKMIKQLLEVVGEGLLSEMQD